MRGEIVMIRLRVLIAAVVLASLSGVVAAQPAEGVRRADYPPESVRLGEEGVVILRVHVTAEGNVDDVQLVSSSGYPRLDEKSLQIVRSRFRYSPARDRNGNPVAAWTQTKISWELN
jgi:periplasmic protein TonB